jgi:hypothetical protein
MVLSYVRIKLPLEEAVQRVATWLNWSMPTTQVLIDSSQAVDMACDSKGRWRGPAVLVHHKNDWTVFEDMTGFLSSRAPEEWLKCAGVRDLVFAGYNDAIRYAELIAISDGEITQDFFFDDSDQLLSRNNGSGLVDADSWIDIAAFVDDDDLVYSDTGLLWQLSEGVL